MEIIITIFLLIFQLKFLDSIQIGYIKHSSVITNTSFISTSNSQCLDCLCNCISNQQQNNSKCYGINCFPSNSTCQQIQQAWIQETELLFNSTSDQFINTINVNFCSCYSVQNILNTYQNITPISITHSMVRYILYNSYDNTLIVLGNNLIGQYYVSNLTQFRNWSVSSTPLAVYINSMNIFISFYDNASVNVYDTNMNYIQSIRRPTEQPSNVAGFYGMDSWQNLLLVSDDELYLVWSINLNTMNMSVYLNLTSYNIQPYNIAVFNNYLYITQFYYSTIYIYNLNTYVMQNINFPNSILLYRLQKDPYCNRFWFGLYQNTYSSVPVFNLNLNQAQVYQSKGPLSTSTVYLATFDSNYSMYTTAINTNYFYKYQMTSMTCAGN
jgi:hypothetical protein